MKCTLLICIYMSLYSRMHICPGQMYPPANRTQSYRAQLHQSSFWYSTMHIYPDQTYPPANRSQSYRAHLHKSSFWYSTMYIYPCQTYPPWIKARATEPDYTKAVSDVAQCTYTEVRCTPSCTQVRSMPPNQTQSYRAWLHQISFQYSTMHIYPGQMYPPNWTQSYRAQLHQSSFQ